MKRFAIALLSVAAVLGGTRGGVAADGVDVTDANAWFRELGRQARQTQEDNGLIRFGRRLDQLEFQRISQICPTGTSYPGNNCAHFVSHVLHSGHGETCPSGASVSVHDLFVACPQVWKLNGGTPPENPCLIFVAEQGVAGAASNGTDRVMGPGRRHIGIYMDGKIWHYSNTRHQVEQATVAQFRRFYGGNVDLFCGQLTTNWRQGPAFR
ncbi:MAG TPA: hypothetical protein VMY42_25695 [Thermoguttaceae bacterium]|nr:hypothetical protein [Thermoguttaceae bacterium]